MRPFFRLLCMLPFGAAWSFSSNSPPKSVAASTNRRDLFGGLIGFVVASGSSPLAHADETAVLPPVEVVATGDAKQVGFPLLSLCCGFFLSHQQLDFQSRTSARNAGKGLLKGKGEGPRSLTTSLPLGKYCCSTAPVCQGHQYGTAGELVCSSVVIETCLLTPHHHRAVCLRLEQPWKHAR